MASYVATERGKACVGTPRKARREVRGAAPAPSQVWPWTSRLAITLVVSRPFMPPIANRAMGGMAATIARPCVGIEPRAAGRHAFDEEIVAGPRVRLVTGPKPLRARLARDHPDNRGTIMGRGTCPVRLWARRRGGSRGARGGGRCFPGVLVQLVRLQSRTPHHPGGCRVVPMGLEALPQGLERCARPPELVRQAGRRLALGNAAQAPHQGRRSLPGLGKESAGEHRVVTLAGPTAVGREMPLRTAQAPRGAAAPGACEPLRRQVALEPPGADAVVQEFGAGAISPVTDDTIWRTVTTHEPTQKLTRGLSNSPPNATGRNERPGCTKISRRCTMRHSLVHFGT
jgi:hypothetical protein